MSDAVLIFGGLALLLVLAAVISYAMTDRSEDAGGDLEHFDHEHSDPDTR